MNLAWPIEIDMPGIASGYSRLNRELRTALVRQGVTMTDEAEVGLYVGPADLFDPQWPVNVLMTMYETETIPPEWVERCNTASAVLVPCQHNKEAFKRSGVQVPIFVVHLGMHAEEWPTMRRVSSSPFRILFVSWPNQRKGLDVLAQAFWQAFLDDPDVELYLKTSQAWEVRQQAYTLKGVERFIVDDRQLSHEDLMALYQSAHVFVLPSRGEGWGFTAMEAMATGCPTVATNYSGLKEFVTPQTGWPIRHGWVDVDYGHLTRAAQPDVAHLTEILLSIRRNYPQAAQRAMKGSAMVKDRFTWEQTAQRTLDCLQRIQQHWRTNGRHTRAGSCRGDRLSSWVASGVGAGV